MPLDEATRRLAFLLQRDLRRLDDEERGRVLRRERVRYDLVARVAMHETERGEALGRSYAEALATYDVHDRILRWVWAKESTGTGTSYAELVFREGQLRGVPQLTMSVLGDLDEQDALVLARLGALCTQAHGVSVERAVGSVDFIGLYEAPAPTPRASAARYSVPPPDQEPSFAVPAMPRVPYRSLPPDILHAVHPPKLREPARAIFLPVARAVAHALTTGSPGFSQALFVATVDPSPGEKRRLVVQLVVIDGTGVLRALDPPAELVEATTAMIDADRRDGNAPWRKLSARILPKPNGGATLHVDVL